MTASAKNVAFGTILLLGAAGVAGGLYWTAPTPTRKPAEARPPLVTTSTLSRTDHALEIEVHGRVEPVTEVVLAPQVAGRITWTHPSFLPGGYIPAGETILRIAPEEYAIAVQTAQAALQVAEEQLALERGRQRAAKVEWGEFERRDAPKSLPDAPVEEQLPREKDLATRGPQLRMAEASVATAKAALQRARLDLARTRLDVPQAVVVASVGATPGTLAQPGQTLGTVYPSSRMYVRGGLPSEQLRWIRPDGPAAAAIWPRGGSEPISGRVAQIAPAVQPGGSLGEIIVEVTLPEPEGPDARVQLPIRAGQLVRMQVSGAVLEDVFVIPRAALHASQVWIVEGDRLHIRRVRPVYRGPERVLVREGLSPGERLVTSQLSQPVDGMTVRVAPSGEGDD